MKMAAYGEQFYDAAGKKITLNFALSTSSLISPEIIRKYFNPDIFLIKLTPVNPTYAAFKNGMESQINNQHPQKLTLPLTDEFKHYGYEVILSIGELEENLIGSNCGQYIQTMLQEGKKGNDSYCYPLIEVKK